MFEQVKNALPEFLGGESADDTSRSDKKYPKSSVGHDVSESSLFSREDHDEGSPYSRATYNHYQTVSNLQNAKRNWQIVAFASLCLAIIFGGGYVYHSMSSSITPYVVEVDESGRYIAARPADNTLPATEQIKKAELATLFQDLRRVTVDQQMQQVLLNRSFNHLYGEAEEFARSWFTEDDFAKDPRRLGGNGVRRRVTVNSIVEMPDRENYYKIEWTEKTIVPEEGTKTTRLEAFAKVIQTEPQSQQQAMSNPLGVYVTKLSWTKQGE